MIRSESDVHTELKFLLLVHGGKLCALLEGVDSLIKRANSQEEKGRMYEMKESLTSRIEKVHADIDALDIPS